MTEEEIRSELMGDGAYLKPGETPDFHVNYLVEAGAGAGKTHTMIQRIVNQLVSGACKPEELVAITFTVKSTQEMRERLDEELRARRDAFAPGDPQWKKLDALVSAAGRMQVSTIHSFCQTMLETMPFATPYGMDMTVLEAGEDWNRARRFFGRCYWADDTAFAAARDRFGIRYAELADAFCGRCQNDRADVVYEPSGSQETAKLEAELRALSALLHKGLCTELQGMGEDMELLAPDLKALLTLSDQEFAASAEHSDALARLRNRNGSPPLSYSEEGKKFQEALRLLSVAATAGLVPRSYIDAHPLLLKWKDIEALWKKGSGLQLKDVVAQLAHTCCMEGIVPLVEEYRAEKVARNEASFDDLLLCARDMLRDNADARKYFHERYRVLYVDEFQDTNPVQAEMLFYLTTDEVHFDPKDWKNCRPEPGSLFLVGDPKQAIYRFRGADIDMYDTVKGLFEAGVGQVRTLAYNYRSSQEVCDLTETAFSQQDGMTKAEAQKRFNGGKHQIPHQAAFTAMVADKGSVPLSRLVTYPALGDSQDAPYKDNDPRQVAAFIRTMLDTQAPLGKDSHTAKPGDFMILTWKRPQVENYVKELAALNIPASASGKQYFHEIAPISRAVLHLKAMLAPQEDLPLARVLRTCYGTEFSVLRRYLQRTGIRHLRDMLYPEKLKGVQKALEQEAAPDRELLALCGVLEELARLREMARTLPAMSVIEQLLDGGYGLWPGAEDPRDHNKAYARVQQYLTAVRDGRERSFPALAAHAIACADNEVERELSLRKEDDYVQVMNIHKAKGLQSEVVILAYNAPHTMAPQKYVQRDDNGVREYACVFTTGKKTNFAIGWPRDWNGCEIKGRPCMKKEEESYVKAETIRLLYVAATRAKSMLVVCGRRQLTEDEKKAGMKLGRAGTTVWQQVADACMPASKDDAQYGAAFEALLKGVCPVSNHSMAGAKTVSGLQNPPVPQAAVTLDTAQLERELLERAKQLSRTTAYAITPSRLDHEAHQGPPARDPEETAIPAEQQAPAEQPQFQAVEWTGPYGPDWGTILHRVMELAVRNGHFDRESLGGFARQAVVETLSGVSLTKTQRIRLTGSDEERTFEEISGTLVEELLKAADFLTREDAPLRRLLAGAEQYPELPFILREQDRGSRLYRHLSAHVSDERAEDKALDVQGIIDLALWKDGQWAVVDYKTDILRKGESQEAFRDRLRQEYTPQIASYAQVLERLGRGPVARTCLCALHLGGELVELDLNNT